MKTRLSVIMIVYFLTTAGILGFITFESEVACAGNTIYVGTGPGNDSATINGGISLASDGDTIFVCSGTYVENIGIWNTINLIGEDKETTIIDGGGPVKVVEIYSDWVNVTGFTITNGMVGFYVYSASNITIKDNIVHDIKKASGVWGTGFFFHGCPYSDNKVIGNEIYNNEADGIHLEDGTSIDELTFWNNSIINNTIYNNTLDGIFFGRGTNNHIIDNIVHHNGIGAINPRASVRIHESPNNSIIGNTVHGNDNGIYLEGSTNNRDSINNTIAGNMVYNNDNVGIRVRDASENRFSDNSIFDNNFNVYFYQKASNNEFNNCTISNASTDDIYLTDDSHTLLLNTTFNKTRVFYGDTLSTLSVNWYMHVNVRYYNESPASGANIWVNDTYGSNIVNGSVNSQGWKRWIVTNEYIEQDLNGDHIGEKIFYYTPHHVAATDGYYWGYADPVMDISKVFIIYLGVPPPLLPPTNLTSKIMSNGNNVELEWDPSPSPALDHYLIYRADSATDFDFSVPYNSSISWSDPLTTTWIDPDPGVTTVNDDFYYIVRAANANESDISSTSNTAGVWTKTFPSGISTFSLPLEPFVKNDAEYYCQDMNASYIKCMNKTSHTWVQHDKGTSGNNTMIEVGEGYEIGFLGKSVQTRYTFTGFPGAMITYDDETVFLGFDPINEARNLSASVDINGNVTLNWQEPASMSSGDWYEVYYSYERDGFFGTFGNDYDNAYPPIGFGNNTISISGLGANNAGARLYFIVVPFNSLGVRGASTYSIGIWTEEFLAQYDTFGIPLKLENYETADWYCDNIPETVGINYFVTSQQRWSWHSTRMPQGAFDPILAMGEGYQISTSSGTKFTFIGV